MIIIIGSGIAGLSAAYHLKQKNVPSVIFEKNDYRGGLCHSFTLDGFTFDTAVHLSFTKNKYVKSFFEKSVEEDYIEHCGTPASYYKSCWFKHPVQNNLYTLSPEFKIDAIESFVNRPSYDASDYKKWLISQYGPVIAETFPIPYTRKYWTVEPDTLTTGWLGNRMSTPDLRDVLEGAFLSDTKNAYYISSLRYPKKGGYQSYLQMMANHANIRLKKRAILVDTEYKYVEFEDGEKTHYNELISSIPLPELIKIIKDVPTNVKLAAKNLCATSVSLISLGFNKPDIARHLWFYIYDKEILPARAYSPNIKSVNNVPEGCSALQFEVYHSKHKSIPYEGDKLIKHVIGKCLEMGLIDSVDDVILTDYKNIDYANVIFDHQTIQNRKIVHEYLDNVGIKYIGRFGEWDYLWSDESFLSGKKSAEMYKK